MKKLIRLLAVFVLAAVFGFSMTACNNGTTDNDDRVLEITVSNEQVYDYDTKDPLDDASIFNGSYPEFWDLLGYLRSLSDDFLSASCTITGGKLTFKLGAPKDGSLNALKAASGYNFGSAASNEANALIYNAFSKDSGDHFLQMMTENAGIRVNYIYVDRAVTINDNAFDNVTLKEGWNTLLWDWSNDTYTNGTPNSSYKWYAGWD